MSPTSLANRAFFLWVLLVLCGVLFAARLFYLQVVRHAHYQAAAVAEHQKKFTLPAKRGLVYAQTNDGVVPLVMNEPVFLLYADPRYVRNAGQTARTLAHVIGGDIKKYEDLLGDRQHSYVVLAKKIPKSQAEAIKKLELYGVGLKESQRRVYPEGQLGSQVLGFVNDEGQGQYGIEGALNDKLKGQDGLLHAVTDVHGIPLSISDQNVLKPAQNGDNVVLSIDRNIQGFAEEALKNGLDKAKATKGSVLVMNPLSGEVLAMASYPTFNPAAYTEIEDYNVFQNSTVSYAYEAGSVIKVMTMAAGVNERVVNKSSTYTNTDSVQVDDTVIKNALKIPGVTSMQKVLQNSMNTGVVHVVQQLGGGKITYQARQKLYTYFTDRFGFGKRTGVEQAGEGQGYLFSPDDEQGNNVRYANMSFGQGMTVTMLQVASAFSAIINGGAMYKPHVVVGAYDAATNTVKKSVSPAGKPIIGADASRQVHDMIVQSLRETPALDMADRPGYVIGGKSGTSQIIDPKTGKYIDENSVGTYIGFGGNHTPKYVIIVRVDDAKIGGYAGTTAAAPIFAGISNWLLDYYKIPPIK